jgi:hypothetical protein
MRTKKPFPPDIIKRIEALLSSIRIESCLRIRSKLGKQIREANFTGLVLLLNANWYQSLEINLKAKSQSRHKLR